MNLELIHESINTLVEQVKSFAHDSQSEGCNPLSKTRVTAESVERHIFMELLKIGRMLMQNYFHELGRGDKGSKLVRNGHDYRRKICKPLTLLTVFGIVIIERWCYYAEGHKGYSPIDETASLPDRQASYFVQRIVGRMSIRDTYDECVKSFKELFGISLSTHTAEQIIKELSLHHKEYADNLSPPAPEPEKLIQVVGFDGKGVAIIKETVPRCEARLKRGEKRNKKKEAMVGLEYVMPESRRSAELVAKALVKPEILSSEELEQLHAIRPAQNIYYQSSLTAGREGIINEISERATKRILDSQTRLNQACVIDGALSLSQTCKKQFPDAEIILDIIHVSERFWQAGHIIFGEGTPKAKEMVYDLMQRTLKGQIGYVIGGLRQRIKRGHLSKKKIEKLEKIITYLDNHRQNMRYDRYLSLGMPIATGVVESACGHLVKDRMGKAGARWSLQGGDAMLRLRSIYASGNWNDYLKFHQQQEHQKLYQLPKAS